MPRRHFDCFTRSGAHVRVYRLPHRIGEFVFEGREVALGTLHQWQENGAWALQEMPQRETPYDLDLSKADGPELSTYKPANK